MKRKDIPRTYIANYTRSVASNMQRLSLCSHSMLQTHAAVGDTNDDCFFFLTGAIHKPTANFNQLRLLTLRRFGTSPLSTARPPALCILTFSSKLLLSSIITRTHSEACLRSSSIRVFASSSFASVSTHLDAGPRSSSMTLFASTISASVQERLSCNSVMMARSNSARVLLRARSSVCDVPLRDLCFLRTVAVTTFSRTADVADFCVF